MNKALSFCVVIVLTLSANTLKIRDQHFAKHRQSQMKPQSDYPVRLAYINTIKNWWPAEKIAEGLGVPGYYEDNPYNFMALTYWTYNRGPVDVVQIWNDPITYMGAANPFGQSKEEVQLSLKKSYNDAGIKIMISAFGPSEFPTTFGIDATQCAKKLGDFVKSNNLDGVDVSYQDNHAMQAGTAEEWLIQFSKELRDILPDHLITHAPQAPYFSAQIYPNKAYIEVNDKVGDLIDFYNVQYYNQGADNTYDTYEKLFVKSGGQAQETSVKELIDKGIPGNKIVVGKPVTPTDAVNTGWMDPETLGAAVSKANTDFDWHSGIAFWQFSSDTNGQAIRTVLDIDIQDEGSSPWRSSFFQINIEAQVKPETAN